MDSTDFKNFMHAQVDEIQKYIEKNSCGPDQTQTLAIQWARNFSEDFRQKWDGTNNTGKEY